jgi:hypothetical protein
MAKVLHDYHCSEHGYFESRDSKCPMKQCAGEVMMVFLQPPGLVSDKTRRNDKNLKQLAIDFKMSDIKSTREGEHQSGYLSKYGPKELNEPTPQPDVPRETRPGDNAIWGNGAGNLNMQNILAGKAVQSVRGESVSINPKDVGNLTGPKAASYIADHDNLKLKK